MGALVVAAVWAPFLVVTATVARPEMEPAVALMVPLPVLLPAVKVTGSPGFGENAPSAGETDQVGETDTEFPYWSWPVAENDERPPTRTFALDGVTEMLASAAGFTVSVWVTFA